MCIFLPLLNSNGGWGLESCLAQDDSIMKAEWTGLAASLAPLLPHRDEVDCGSFGSSNNRILSSDNRNFTFLVGRTPPLRNGHTLYDVELLCLFKGQKADPSWPAFCSPQSCPSFPLGERCSLPCWGCEPDRLGVLNSLWLSYSPRENNFSKRWCWKWITFKPLTPAMSESIPTLRLFRYISQ